MIKRMLVYQSKDKENVPFFSSLYTSVTLVNTVRRSQKVIKILAEN